MPTPEDIRELLFSLQDIPYRDFTAKLIPNVDPATIIGIRSPAFRKAAKEIWKAGENDAFLRQLPHAYFEEINLHAYLVTQGKDFDAVVRGLDEILPYIDNWASCDSIRSACIPKGKRAAVSRVSALDGERPALYRPLRDGDADDVLSRRRVHAAGQRRRRGGRK